MVLPRNAVALEPDEIALIVNSNVPEGAELAQFYAQQRHIPDNRILVLDLPKTDNMPNRQYADYVVPQVREFLKSGHLESKVKCLVTFYGVPLGVDTRINTSEETDEQTDIRRQLITMADAIRPAIEATEALAKKLSVQFEPEKLNDLDHLLGREQAATNVISNQIAGMGDPQRQAALATEFYTTAEPLLGEKAHVSIMQLTEITKSTTQPVDKATVQKAVQHYKDMVQLAGELQSKPNDGQARQKLRQIARDNFGLIKYVNLLRDQTDYLTTDQSAASFDNELAMVQWEVYPHRGFYTNPLFYGVHGPGLFRTMMVTRLDAPQAETVKALITNSIKTEEQGLTGQIVIDSRGIKPGEEAKDQAGFGMYDQSLRDLAELLSDHTKMKVLLDEKPEVLPPGSANDVALYCGWYSLRNYVPSCKFNPGAVGYHIASYELISLRQPGERGWVHGLLNDGVVGTLGAVAEPYLGTFPHPNDFFPLVLTGKLTMAEVYWKTEPTVSWMQCYIGDPLYTPYKKNPQLPVIDLPLQLRQIFKTGASAH